MNQRTTLACLVLVCLIAAFCASCGSSNRMGCPATSQYHYHY